MTPSPGWCGSVGWVLSRSGLRDCFERSTYCKRKFPSCHPFHQAYYANDFILTVAFPQLARPGYRLPDVVTKYPETQAIIEDAILSSLVQSPGQSAGSH